MTAYSPPTDDMQFVMTHVASLEHVLHQERFSHVDVDIIAPILEEAGKFASQVLSPLNAVGDKIGAQHMGGGRVAAAEGYVDAYRKFSEGGWNGLGAAQAYGGQALPMSLVTCVTEMLNASNLSFALCPLLTQGVLDALEVAGSEAQKHIYMPPLIEGCWSGTMNLTEPQSGTDLASIKTLAQRRDDGSETWSLTGQKIFITWGEHDMTDNIVHLVLARTPNAPSGVKGLSLFIVPKFLPDAQGQPGQRNDVLCASLERKIGIHASPTAVMLYGEGDPKSSDGSDIKGGAVAWMVGEEGRGIEYMFIMMNRARFDVGLQGLAISEAAYQQALSWATERVQGTPIGRESGTAILGHQDVKRMLLTMRCRIEAMRALAGITAAEIDLSKSVSTPDARAAHDARASFLIPIVKGWLTELALEITSTGVQIHGGMGFVEDTGAGQYYRDARILPIYEGTTGIQANDLVFRKLLRDDAAAAHAVLEAIDADIAEVRARGQFDDLCDQLADALDITRNTIQDLQSFAKQEPQRVAACAHAFLFMAGYLCGGWQMLRSADKAQQQLSNAPTTGPVMSRSFLTQKIQSGRFFITAYMPEVAARAKWMQCAAHEVVGADDSYFSAAS